LLHGVQSDLIEAQTYQDMPFEKLVDALEVERDPSRHPIFQVMYSVQHGTEVGSGESIEFEIAKFDLSVSILVTPTAIRGRMQYATSLFKKETIERMIGHYQRLLTEMLSSPERLISQYTMLSSDEYERLVYGWNETERP
ncbi:condensation domain-containing protein, partial [Legionella oakridgensis]|uniref:condensation domain-containing protein n=1 Tax=Legionella oakridgensis TaxID=29423 RepID=UPI00055A27E9